MDSMYKVGRFRLALLIGATLMAIMIPFVTTEVTRRLLLIAVLWLALTAALIQLSYRLPIRAPWQLVPSLLLASLLWADPMEFSIWLWGFALLLMLPQPVWMAVLNVLLATFGWWQVKEHLGLGQGALVGLVLVALMMMGLARTLHLRPLWQDLGQRQRLIPGARLWSIRQLQHDLARETARSDREETHSELLLLRTSGQRSWAMAHQLCHTTERYESCYRLDRRTLAVLLPSLDVDHASARRGTILDSLEGPVKARAIQLDHPFTLADQCQALDRQHVPLVVIKGNAIHA